MKHFYLTDTKFEEVITLIQMGVKLKDALVYIQVSPKVFHDTVSHNKIYRDKYRSAKKFLPVSAIKQLSVAIMKGDIATIRWYLERRNKDYMPIQKNINENYETNKAVSDLNSIIGEITGQSRNKDKSKE